jgi:PEP-CTERM motif
MPYCLCMFVRIAAAMAMVAASSAAPATVIDTTGSLSAVGSLGTGFRAIGQTFVAPPGEPRLQNVSVFLSNNFPPDGVLAFAFYIMPWQGSEIPSEILYASPAQNVVSASRTQFTFDIGGLNLTAEQPYAFFVDTGNAQTVAGAMINIAPDNVYTAGQIVSATIGAPFSSLTTSTINIDDAVDLQFIAMFTAVPEPGSILLVGLGMIGLVGYGIRRRRSA